MPLFCGRFPAGFRLAVFYVVRALCPGVFFCLSAARFSGLRRTVFSRLFSVRLAEDALPEKRLFRKRLLRGVLPERGSRFSQAMSGAPLRAPARLRA